ncbi:general secretion pathway protein GspJ [Sorangium cellulosum]|uniref:Type II secretion system protein J n=1 Tax=Sorangium cellulosum TaxID=56 RepID=A0A2L0FBT2_SORCE|nr:type II secretion system protein GspJ [Sorangium cellulosum]AUX49068.1 general secretion pathway protein GspJ [Sorangium cellulosum]
MAARSAISRRGRVVRRGREGGMTLLEVIVSVGILAIIGTLIYGAFDGMSRSRAGISRMSDRYHQGRAAIARISREIQSAFLSRHQPFDKNIVVRLTAFVGDDTSPADRLDFTAFAHRRLLRNTHESDQCEIGYFGSRDPDRDKLDLVRREAKIIDVEPTRGGVVNVLAEDIESFNVEFLDPITGEWTDTWDSTQPAAQFERLPAQVRVTLVLNGGPGGEPIRFETKVPIAMQVPIAFGVSN